MLEARRAEKLYANCSPIGWEDGIRQHDLPETFCFLGKDGVSFVQSGGVETKLGGEGS